LEKEITMNITQQKGLRRSRNNRVLAGVCGGMSEFFGISVFWFRLAFLLAFLPGGVPGIGLYLLCWLIIPAA
jgi:phage shock protein C